YNHAYLYRDKSVLSETNLGLTKKDLNTVFSNFQLIFGKNEQEIKNIKENSYLKKRQPQAGDVIRIDNLSPTTQKLGGQGILCGKRVSIFTKKHETIKDVTYRAISLIQASCSNSKWELGTNISPELVYYWNCDLLGNISPTNQLIPGMPVVIYSDYLPYQSPKNSRNQLSNKRKNIHEKLSIAVKRKTGTKYISYDIQNHNILEGNLVRNISTIFRLSSNELVKWNPWLSKLGTRPRRWSKKQKTIVIKNCPESIQKFGNPGIVCNKGLIGEDTRLTMLKGEKLSQTALRAKKMIQSCGGKGKGISPKNILYWNADNLQAAGVRGLKDRSQKTIKLTIYSDFY
ncbi:soluble lytic murein transglycosylase-like protein, partial [Candidatus Magnetomorum sp. HK-1]